MEDKIKKYIKDNLSIQISADTNDFMTTDGSTATRFDVMLILEGEVISEDSCYQ